MFALTAFGDICIGIAAFAAGVYFHDWAVSAYETIKSVVGWVKAKF